MMEAVAIWLIRVAGWYLLIGFFFGLYFAARGAGRIDPSARDTGAGFKLIILPGVIALWPLLLCRVIKKQNHPPMECNAHRKAAEEC